MAQQAKQVCCYPGCYVAQLEPYCEKHRRDKPVRAPDLREHAAARGYDAKWQRLRAAFLASSPLCVHCRQAGRVRPAQDVDHIVPFEGKDDPNRLLASNLQALCRPCHNKKTRRQGSS